MPETMIIHPAQTQTEKAQIILEINKSLLPKIQSMIDLGNSEQAIKRELQYYQKRIFATLYSDQ